MRRQLMLGVRRRLIPKGRWVKRVRLRTLIVARSGSENVHSSSPAAAADADAATTRHCCVVTTVITRNRVIVCCQLKLGQSPVAIYCLVVIVAAHLLVLDDIRLTGRLRLS